MATGASMACVCVRCDITLHTHTCPRWSAQHRPDWLLALTQRLRCRDGRAAGLREGRELGVRTGFEVAEEVGFYSGCTQARRGPPLRCFEGARRAQPRSARGHVLQWPCAIEIAAQAAQATLGPRKCATHKSAAEAKSPGWCAGVEAPAAGGAGRLPGARREERRGDRGAGCGLPARRPAGHAHTGARGRAARQVQGRHSRAGLARALCAGAARRAGGLAGVLSRSPSGRRRACAVTCELAASETCGVACRSRPPCVAPARSSSCKAAKLPR